MPWNWKGTFSEIVPNLKIVIQRVKDRADELENRVDPGVQKTCTDLHRWLFVSDYTALREASVDYYNPYMPIKHEYYPALQDPNDPHFDIYIQIVKK